MILVRLRLHLNLHLSSTRKYPLVSIRFQNLNARSHSSNRKMMKNGKMMKSHLSLNPDEFHALQRRLHNLLALILLLLRLSILNLRMQLQHIFLNHVFLLILKLQMRSHCSIKTLHLMLLAHLQLIAPLKKPA